MSDEELSRWAWMARDRARLKGNASGTKVGCAVQVHGGGIFTGFNIEHRFRSHDIHAEIAALSAAAAAGAPVRAILIAAEREQFTPCGACLDWIFELGSPSTLVIHEYKPGGTTVREKAGNLMPYYPF